MSGHSYHHDEGTGSEVDMNISSDDFNNPGSLGNFHYHHHDDISGYESGNEVGHPLPLKTPDRRLLTSDNTTLEVGKRLHSPSSDCDHSNDSTDEKRRQVAKSLFGNSTMEGPKCSSSPASRSLFGPPSLEENQRLLKEFEKKNALEYEAAVNRYEIIEKTEKCEYDVKLGNYVIFKEGNSC